MDEFSSSGDDPRELGEVSLRPSDSELVAVHLPDGKKIYFKLTAKGRLQVSVKHGGLVIRPVARNFSVVEVEPPGDGGHAE